MPDEAHAGGANVGVPSAHRRRVVIVGGGFGGLTAARELRHADVEVTVVDRVNHHLFQPLLYQVACGGLSTAEIAPPIRIALRRATNMTVLMAKATALDAERRRLVLDDGEHLHYDSLIVSCGAQTSYFGNEPWHEVTCGLKTLADAIDLRNRIYSAFERAERTEDEDERRELLTFVVIGGGPTGVEIAGELAIVAKDTLSRDYARISPRDTRVILLDAGERVIPSFSERLSRKAAKALTSIGVTVRVGAPVTAIDARGVTIEVDSGIPQERGGAVSSPQDREEATSSPRKREETGERIAARTVIWAAGVRAVPFAAVLAHATGASTDRAGRVQIEPDLTVPGHREISVIGDAALLSGADGEPLPGLATVAIQQARHVAKAIRDGAPSASTPFRYFDKGTLAVVGRGRAVCAIRGLEISGRPAFLTYMTVHMYYLGGVPGRRLKVLIEWATARLGNLQNQLIEGDLASVERPAADGPTEQPATATETE
jgi:NADH:ubiquinone reductase (H+-translocating)